MMLNGPQDAELQLAKLYGGMVNGRGQGMQGFNTGQDALLQIMRSDPMQRTLSGQERFDTSGLFAALEPMEQRAQRNALMQLRGSAGSLGQRFGTAFAGREADLLANMTEQAGARRAGISQQSYEAAQARRMQGMGQYAGMAQDYAGNSMAQQAQLMNLIQMMNAASMGRNQFNAGLAGMAAGIPQAPGFGGQIAQTGTDIATLMYLLKNRGGSGGSSVPTVQAPVFNTPPMTWGL
jgi:hypothetical protein